MRSAGQAVLPAHCRPEHHDRRLTLVRRLHPDATAPELIFIMLNPSRADDTVDDATVRRCLGFARREQAGALRIVNLFVQRTSRPAKLWRTLAAGEPADLARLALAAIRDVLIHARPQDRIVCAWGSARASPAPVRLLRLARIAAVLSLARRHGHTLHCLGLTQDGSPRHPLYVRSDQPLLAFDPA